ncbi:MAG: RSP_2648 family PIN domain-containing protein [Alkalilacustris sp.]
MAEAPPRAVLDACVLYPSVLRGVLIDVARADGMVPLWSTRILAEWAHVARRRGDDAGPALAALTAEFPDADVGVADAVADLPDPADAHVLGAAVAGRADLIVTRNLRDFPARALAPFGLRAEAPDALLMHLWGTRPRMVEAAVAGVVAETERISGRPQPVRALLRRAGLPRLGKALAPPAG